jgi:hypothetical protein
MQVLKKKTECRSGAPAMTLKAKEADNFSEISVSCKISNEAILQIFLQRATVRILDIGVLHNVPANVRMLVAPTAEATLTNYIHTVEDLRFSRR